ncbi:MAG TPA: type II secretion system protein GspK [Verrucomicrobiota bacterium]|nr:type II secretion system protein GspK [Verrucomicrobiota bacterium]
MLIKLKKTNKGIALIIVMIVITFLSIMAGGFAYSMKVETRLARNSFFDNEMEWLGRSGIELARYVLGQQKNIPNEPYDSLNQKWAGGVGPTNGLLSDITLENIPLGNGTITVKITDMERKFNINIADEMILNQAFTLIGVEAAEARPIINSILDWLDPDDEVRVGGAESDFYENLEPPYVAKNGPMDDVSELLLIRNVIPEIYYGPHYTGAPSPSPTWQKRFGAAFSKKEEMDLYAVGLVDLFCTFSGRFININTATATTLQLIPGIDENVANEIITRRAGPDGQEGTEDDTPFRTIGELMAVPGMNPQLISVLSRVCSTQSTTFEVKVEVQLDQRKRTFTAILRRLDQKNIPMICWDWK